MAQDVRLPALSLGVWPWRDDLIDAVKSADNWITQTLRAADDTAP